MRNPDGSLNLDLLETWVKSTTSSLADLDAIVKANKLGVDLVLAFQCGHSGLYYPGDYVKEWGKLYGIGLGPDVCSECFDTDYDTAPPDPFGQKLKSLSQIMHPMGNSKAQVDRMLVPRVEYEANLAILDLDDVDVDKRAAVVMEKQLVNPRSQIPIFRAAFARMAEGGSYATRRN